MNVTAVVGAGWGDEGKGKLVDELSAKSDLVIRFQGGDNAGHTVINPYGRFALHMLPSGVFHPEVKNLIGNATALNMMSVLKELDELKARGVPDPQLWISDRAQILLPTHLLIDELEEDAFDTPQFGSTRRGIAPFYASKAMRAGLRVGDLLNSPDPAGTLRAMLQRHERVVQAYGHRSLDVDAMMEMTLSQLQALRPRVCDAVKLVDEVMNTGGKVLLEGQLGALKDPDHGIYPYTTASSPLAAQAAVGSGIPPKCLGDIIAVVKAYSSCVGEGPFVSECFGTQANELRDRGGDRGEYGATTGRPRRVGWFDAVAMRYGCRLQSATVMALSLLDVLSYLDEIPVCVAYEIYGRRCENFPLTCELTKAKPIVEVLPGWRCDISACRKFSELPIAAQQYVERVEKLVGLRAAWISVGPERGQTLYRERS